MKLIPISEWASLQQPPISRRRASKLAQEGRIKGAVMLGRYWFCPIAANRRVGRLKR